MRQMNNKRILIAFLVIVLTMPIGGCWDNKDINHRSLPIVMGIAKNGDQYQVILQVPEPSNTNASLRVIKGQGSTISAVVDQISTNMESQIDLLHLKLILFEDKFAQEGLGDAVESFMRSHDISSKVMVAICDEPLESFFHNIDSYTQNNGTVLLSFFEKEAGWNPQVASTHIWEIYRSMRSFTHDIAMPIVHSGTGTVIKSNGSAIIRNGRMVGKLTKGETLLVSAFSGSSAMGKIEVMENVTVEIICSINFHHHRIRDGIPYLQSKIRLRVTLLETKGNPSPQLIKEEVDKLLRARYDRVMRKMKAAGADIMAAGQYFRGDLDRDQLQRWRQDYLPKLEYEVEVNTVIQNTGLLRGDS
ncbi:Ger(x)C family spore germination protein [Paenibacillus sp. strain BS8-2]